jgi:hypothetical protein
VSRQRKRSGLTCQENPPRPPPRRRRASQSGLQENMVSQSARVKIAKNDSARVAIKDVTHPHFMQPLSQLSPSIHLQKLKILAPSRYGSKSCLTRAPSSIMCTKTSLRITNSHKMSITLLHSCKGCMKKGSMQCITTALIHLAGYPLLL